ADRAVRDVQRGEQDPVQARRGRGPVAGRVLHHVAGDGRHVRDVAEGRRRAAVALGRSGQDTSTPVGDLTSMTDDVTTAALGAWVRRFADLVAEQRDHLTELDSAIGDADHGTNLERGKKAAVAALAEQGPGAA